QVTMRDWLRGLRSNALLGDAHKPKPPCAVLPFALLRCHTLRLPASPRLPSRRPSPPTYSAPAQLAPQLARSPAADLTGARLPSADCRKLHATPAEDERAWQCLRPAACPLRQPNQAEFARPGAGVQRRGPRPCIQPWPPTSNRC